MCPYIWQSNHIWQVGGPIINEDLYQSLDPELQEILVKTAEEISVEQRAAYIAGEEKYVEELIAKGATVSPLDTFKDMDEVYDRFKNGFWKESAKRLGAEDMLDKMLEVLGRK
jgi:TRAP-type C4-dicarboxylate transport system substrate-binding protein